MSPKLIADQHAAALSLNIGKKLTLTNTLMALSAIVVAIALSRVILSVEQQLQALNNRTLQITSLLERIRFSSLLIISSTNEYLFIVEAAKSAPDKKSPSSRSQATVEIEQVQKGITDLDLLLEQYRELTLAYFPDEISYMVTIENNRDILLRQSRMLLQASSAALSSAELIEAKESFEEIEKNFLQSVDSALDHEADEYRESLAELHETIDLTNMLTWTGLIGVALLVLILGISTTRSIVDPLRRMTSAIDDVKRGDYSQRIESQGEDELGRLAASFNDMARQLKDNKRMQKDFVEQLEQKNSELERFNYTVSHDLKSPLVTVKGFLGMLEKDIATGDTSAIERDIEYLNSATTTMGLLLEDLLELSRIGRVANPSTSFPMSGLCHEVVESLEGLIRERRAEIYIDPDMPDAFADQTRIREVIQNLVENAIKFSQPERNPRIRLGWEQRDGAPVFIVEDNGIGIEEKYREKIFGLFERLDAKVSGTGIGLALVKRIVETHGGSIWAEPRDDNSGTRFCFTLPQSRDDSASKLQLAASQN